MVNYGIINYIDTVCEFSQCSPHHQNSPLLSHSFWCLISELVLWFRMTWKQMSWAKVPRGRNVTEWPYKSMPLKGWTDGTEYPLTPRWGRLATTSTLTKLESACCSLFWQKTTKLRSPLCICLCLGYKNFNNCFLWKVESIFPCFDLTALPAFLRDLNIQNLAVADSVSLLSPTVNNSHRAVACQNLKEP